MSAQHLSDEAVAACADGVLGGRARDRASKHTETCAECREAVRMQREAVWALRAAPLPAPPTDLIARLRSVPQTTSISTLPTVVAPDGSTMLVTRLMAPMAAFAPAPQQAVDCASTHRVKPFMTAAFALALAGALSAGSVGGGPHDPAAPGTGQVARYISPAENGQPAVTIPISVVRPQQP